jgi:ribosomal protein L19E
VKKADLEKLKGRKIAGAGAGSARGGQGAALDKRDQALARKRELLEKLRKPKQGGD